MVISLIFCYIPTNCHALQEYFELINGLLMVLGLKENHLVTSAWGLLEGYAINVA